MYSERYEMARKEFKNCLWMSVIGMGVPIYNAIHEWWPIMQEEKRKALSAGVGPEAAEPADSRRVGK